MAMDIVAALLEANIEEVPRTIFLLLDPASLKASRGVCHQWDDFILAQVPVIMIIVDYYHQDDIHDHHPDA